MLTRLSARREDLIETHIHICAPEVLSTFADDFDYQQLDDLVRTALEGDEVPGRAARCQSCPQIRDYRIFAHVLTSEYAARVGNLHSYHAIRRARLGMPGCS